jgi:hypothetical protein
LLAGILLALAALVLPAQRAVAVAAAAAAPAPSNLRVERLLERDALGLDGAAPLLLRWGFEHDPAADRAERGGAAPAVLVELVGGDSGATVWSHSVPEGGTTAVRYGGPVLRGAARYRWTVCARGGSCAASSFLTAPAGWGGAQWIVGRQLRSPKLALGGGGKTVQQATVAVTGLGFYELRLNGEKVGDAELDPGFSTNYTERVLYAVHDVTAAVQSAAAATADDDGGGGGELVLAARVGAGKYSMAVSHSVRATTGQACCGGLMMHLVTDPVS